MPYEYRKLSPKEREEIVKYRQEYGHPFYMLLRTRFEVQELI